jgi:mannose-6-phosphate isomerase-like protein (cupin superfamily)
LPAIKTNRTNGEVNAWRGVLTAVSCGRRPSLYIDPEELGVSLFRYAPGKVATDGHHHKEQEEAYVVVSGSRRIKLDDEAVELKVFDVVRVAPHVVRAFEAGPEGLEVIAVGGRKPEEGDGVHDKGRWPAE